MLADQIKTLERPAQTTIEVYTDEEESGKSSDTPQKTSIGDLYILGKLWIDILQTGLLGSKWRLPPLLPVVKAAAPPPPSPPQKPPKMKYKDLPLYTSPHLEYKDYLEDKPKCPDLKRKLMHEKVLPHVKSYRKHIGQNYSDFVSEARTMKKDAMCHINSKKNDFLSYMRCGKNLQLRQAVLAFGGLAGFLLSRKCKMKTSPRFIYPAIGLLAAGALCFPVETDKTFRDLSHATGTFLICFYNKFCNKKFGLQQRLPCQTDLPGPLPPRTPNKCPADKK